MIQKVRQKSGKLGCKCKSGKSQVVFEQKKLQTKCVIVLQFFRMSEFQPNFSETENIGLERSWKSRIFFGQGAGNPEFYFWNPVPVYFIIDDVRANYAVITGESFSREFVSFSVASHLPLVSVEI